MPDQAQSSEMLQATIQLRMFFPETVYTGEEIGVGLQNDQIIIDGDKMLRYLQSALLDEKIIEIQLDNEPKKYFARLSDHPPSADEIDEESNDIEENTPYKIGDYLFKMNHLISLPVEPGMGNPTLRRSGTIVLRVFTDTYTVEFGTFYENIVHVDEVPMLQLSFPAIARILKEAREFRAKVSEELNLSIIIPEYKNRPEMRCSIYDISTDGMSFYMEREQRKILNVDDVIEVEIFLDNELLLTVDGTIIHMRKMRQGKIVQFICGLHLRPDTLSTIAKIESLVAKVQRAHLQEITEKSNKYGIRLII